MTHHDPSSTDPRTVRTRSLLINAVLDLAAERDIQSISVHDVTIQATLHRTTFYRHYHHLDELIADALDTLFHEFTSEDREFVQAHIPLSPDHLPAGIVSQVQHVTERPGLYLQLLGGTGSSAFAARLRAYHQAQFHQIWRHMQLTATPGSPPVDARAHVAAGAVQGVLGWWLEQGLHEPVTTIATWLWTMLRPLWFENTTSESS